jgi:signal peptidase I
MPQAGVRETVSWLAAQLVRRFGQARIKLAGTSMLPSIWPGDVVTVGRRATCDVGIGDVVLFTREDRLFAHRVVENEGSVLITRGDSHSENDPPVTEKELLGVVTAIQRGRKRFLPSRELSGRDRFFGRVLTSSALLRRLVPQLVTAWNA